MLDRRTYVARRNVNELQSIIEAHGAMAQRGLRMALATVVNVAGSAYRRPGARMLIAADGRTVGSVSGGCLERDVLNHAQRVLQSNEPRVVTYDAMSGDDIVWEFNLGCNGIIDVLIEPLPTRGNVDVLAFLADCLSLRHRGIIATLFAVEGPMKATIGNRLLLSGQKPAIHDIGNDALAEAIGNDSRQALADGRSTIKRYELAAGCAQVFIEIVQPPVPLIVLGAGYDAVPVVRLAKELGWHVTVVDPRPGHAIRTRFPLADALIVCRPEEVCKRIPLDRGTVAVVMTHNFLHDAELLMALIPSPLLYLGLLGPKQRAQRLLDGIQNLGVVLSQSRLGQIYGPMGLDIGADTPDEIALAVIAEIQAVLTGRLGGMLRTRERPLHEERHGVEVIPVSGTIQGALSCGYAY